MYNYARSFPKDIIPHIRDDHTINDTIHNYIKRPIPQAKPDTPGGDQFMLDDKKTAHMSEKKPRLSNEDIQKAQKEI